MTSKKIVELVLSVAIVHFIITSLIGHYIAVHVGTEIGQVAAGGLTTASDGNNEEEPTRIYQNVKSQSDEIEARWQIPELIISLPAKYMINPLLQDIRKKQIDKVINKTINRDQFRTRALLIDYTANFLNSVALGLLVYVALRIINQKTTRGST